MARRPPKGGGGSIRGFLASRGLAPSKARGQNFLRSPETARRLIAATELGPEHAAVEIGPGLGALTREIAARARRTVALELDRGLVELLAGEGLPSSVEVRHQDALEADLAGLVRELGPPVMLLGNLPYNIAGRLLGNLLGPRNPFRRLGLMLQAEVADRVLATPGTAAYGPLAVYAALWAEASRAVELGPQEFEPRPRVRSSFLIIDPVESRTAVREPRALRGLVRAAYGYRRKTLRAALRRSYSGVDAALEASEIEPARRGETLSPAEFVRLADALGEAR